MKKHLHVFQGGLPFGRRATRHTSSAVYRAVFLVVGFFFTAPLPAQNLVTNSNFINNGNGWNVDCSMEVFPETIYGGVDPNNYVTEVDGERCFSQTICVAGGLTYTLSLNTSRRIDSNTPPSPGFVVSIVGTSTGSTYIQQITTRSNTTWALTTETYTFTVPAGSADKYVNLAFVPYLNSASYGIILSDIELHPLNDMSLTGNGTVLAGVSNGYSVVNNQPGILFVWGFDSGSLPDTSVNAAPSVSWSTPGTKMLTAVISNDVCVVATLSKPVMVIALLPLEITHFTGNVNGRQAALSWTAADEPAGSRFTVERSADGAHFTSIGSVPGQTTGGTNSYSFLDDQYASPAYYRLQTADINGNVSYSNVILLQQVGGPLALNLYASPAGATLQYSATAKQPAAARVEVMNSAGQRVYTGSTGLRPGVNEHTLDISQLPPGVYFFRMSAPAAGVSIVKPFCKP